MPDEKWPSGRCGAEVGRIRFPLRFGDLLSPALSPAEAPTRGLLSCPQGSEDGPGGLSGPVLMSPSIPHMGEGRTSGN
jgi:hypothetical protein